MRRLIFIVISFLLSVTTHARLPLGQTVISETVKTHGKKTYVLQTEFKLTNDVDTLSIDETWTVKDGEQMHVLARLGTTPIQYLEFIYGGGKRTSHTADGNKGEHLSAEFMEPFFHFRSFASMAKAMITAKMIPDRIFAKKSYIRGKDLSTFQPEPESFLHLARTQGIVAFGLGSAEMDNPEDHSPALWIEQDSFLIRKIRFATGLEILADNYAAYPNDLRYPQIRTISHDGIKGIVTIKSIKPGSENSPVFQTNRLVKRPPLNLNSTQAQFVNFYLRLR